MQSGVRDYICSKKVFWGRNLRKQLPNSESKPFNTPIDRVSFKTKHFEVSEPNLPGKDILGSELRKRLLNSESTPLKTSICGISLKRK